MSEKTKEIIEQLKSITLLEAAELVAEIEETFGVDASVNAGGSIMVAPTASNNINEESVQEKTEFDVILEEVPSAKRISVIKAIRNITSLGLKEAKDLIESLPKQVKEAVTKEEAEDTKKLLEEAGGKSSIK